MAGTEYKYTITLDGQQALQAAQNFKTQFEQELSQMTVQAQVNISGIQQQLQQIQQPAQQAVANRATQLFQREWGTTMKQFQREFGAVAPEAMMGQLKSYFQETVDQPAQGAIERLRGVQQSVGDATQSLKRMGITAQDWLGAGTIERYGMAIQAAQRRWWGVRGAGYQVQAYGRGMMMAGAAGVGAGAVAAKQYIEYAEPLNRAARNLELNAQMTQVLDERMRSLAGTVSLFSPEEQAQQLYLWAAATGEVVDTTQELDTLLQRTGEVQKLASLGMVDQGQAVEAVTDVMSQYQLNVDDTQKIVATLVKVAATSKAEVSDLAMAFRYAGVGAEAANTSFEETAATLQLLSAFGLRGSRAGRGLARLMENLIAPSDEAKKRLDALFEDAFGRTDVLVTAQGEFVGLANAIDILADATANLTEMERAEFVARITTQNASRVLLPLLQVELEGRQRNIDAIQAQTNILNGHRAAHEDAFVQMMNDIFGYEVSTKSAIDTLDDQWDQFLESTDGRAKRIKALFDGAMTSIGAAVTQMALPALEDLAVLVGQIGELATKYPGAVSVAMGLAGGLAAVGALTVAVGKLITLYADMRMVMTAGQLYQDAAAAMNLHAGEIMQLAAMEMIIAAEIMSGVPAQQAIVNAESMLAGWAPAAGAGAAGVGAAGTGIGGMLLTGTAIVGLSAVLAAVISNAITMATTGRTAADIFNVSKEAGEAYGAAVTEVAKVEREEVEELLEKARREKELLQRYYRSGGGFFAPGGPGMRGLSEEQIQQERLTLAQVPEKYKPVGGLPMAKLIEEDIVKAEKEIEAYEQRLLEIEKAQRGVWYEAQRAAEAQERQNEVMRQGQMIMVMQAQQQSIQAMQAAVVSAKEEELAHQRSINNMLMAQSRNLVSGQIGQLIQLAQATGISADKFDLLNMEMYELVQLIGPGGLNIDLIGEAMKGLSGSIPTTLDLATQAGQTGKAGKQMFLGMADVWGWNRVMEGMQDYLVGLEELYREADAKNWTEDRIAYEIAAYEEIYRGDLQSYRDNLSEKERLSKQFVADQKKLLEDAEQGFEGLISAALKPTDVTWEDVQATNLGVYKDKWDEPARRMKAAMYDPSSEWHDLIPPDIWQQGPEAAQAFGERWLDDFYAGMMPDAINWGAFVEDFMRNLNRQAGQENLIERAKQELFERKGITATSEQVLTALGLQSPMQQMFFGGLAPTDAGKALQGGVETAMGQVSFTDEMAEGPAKSFATVMTGGLTTQLSEIDWGQKMINAWSNSFENKEEDIKGLGGKWWNLVYQGMMDAVDRSDLVSAIAELVLQMLNDAYARPPQPPGR